MIGFDNGNEKSRYLNESKDDLPAVALFNAKLVSSINTNLTYQADTTLAERLAENANICFQGPVKVGSFDIDKTFAQKMFQVSNPNGKSNADVVKPWMNASDITGQPRNMWIIDFGEMEMNEAAYYEMPFEYVKKHIKPLRDKNNDRQRRTYWWRLGRSGSDLKNAKKGKGKIIVTPRVAKHRVFIWADIELVPDSRLFAFARDDDYFFGILHSRIHQGWSLATSSRHGVGNDPTYNNTTCFETFPFPWAPGAEPKDDPRVQAIAQAAKELVEQRDRWLNATPTPPPPNTTMDTLNADSASGSSDLGEVPAGQRGSKRTLTNLYNARPTWLDLAHKRLDQAVFAAYGWKPDLSDDEILEKLLALNMERAKQ